MMKINVFLIVCFALVATTAALAQDASYPAMESVESENDHARDRVIFGGEGDPMINNKIHVPVVAVRDSTSSRPVKTVKTEPAPARPSARPSSQEDDSILSFNFLYYIFEKYKMQDVVD